MFRLTVENGSARPEHAAGQTVHVWADPRRPGTLFDRWTGDTELLADDKAPHTTFVMPAHDVSLAASYRPAPIWKAIREPFGDTEVFYYFPPSHVGLIGVYHGMLGGAGGWTDGKLENRLFCEEAVAAGYAILAMESLDRQGKRWDNQTPPDQNPDIARVRYFLDSLKERGLLGEGEPVFGVGMSNGGAFVSLVSYALGYGAAAIYGSAGLARVIARTTIPTIWCPSERDGAVGGVEKPLAHYRLLKDRGVDAEIHVNKPSPVYPRRFWRIPGLDAADSETIYASLKEHGLLDEGDYLVSTLSPFRRDPAWQEALDRWQKAIVSARGGFFAPYLVHIVDQLAVCYAEHKFHSDGNRQVLRFFDAHRQ